MTVARLENVPLRAIWPREEQDFSSWLCDNVQVLGDALGLELSEPQQEVAAGSFTVDLVAEDARRGRVIIENQLGATDHDHLGKLLTYLTNLDAKTAIWITSKPRPEHTRAVLWLNEMTPDDVAFYLVKLAAYRIGDSAPAPLFTVITGPSAEGKGFGAQKKELAKRHWLRLKFWKGLLARAKEKGVLTHERSSPSTDCWLSGPSGRRGVDFMYSVWVKDRAAVAVYIDTGQAEENERIFNDLATKKTEIEKAFGGPLEWERMEDKRACRIRYTLHLGGLSAGEDEWPKIWDPLIDAMQRLVDAFKPYIRSAGM